MKYEQKVQVEMSEYICLVKRIDGVVAQKTLEQELIRCKDCKHTVEHKGYGYLGESAYTCESNMDGWILPDSYCSKAERREK